MRIALFGGSFDPVHWGHIALAKAAHRELELNKLFFIPAGKSPLKARLPFEKPAHRLKMLKLALGNEKHFEVSNIEIKSTEPSYTIHAVRAFCRDYPKSEIFLLMGSDALKDFKKWKDWKGILKRCRIVVGRRKGERIRKNKIGKEISENAVWLKTELPAISSTFIRQSLSVGSDRMKGIPKNVLDYIQKHGLYCSQ